MDSIAAVCSRGRSALVLTQSAETLETFVVLVTQASDWIKFRFGLLRPSFAWLRVLSVRNNAAALRHSNASCRVTLVFNNLQPAELAEQLTFLEYKTFRRVTVDAFLIGVYFTEDKLPPAHGFRLPLKDDRNFIPRLLFKDMY